MKKKNEEERPKNIVRKYFILPITSPMKYVLTS